MYCFNYGFGQLCVLAVFWCLFILQSTRYSELYWKRGLEHHRIWFNPAFPSKVPVQSQYHCSCFQFPVFCLNISICYTDFTFFYHLIIFFYSWKAPKTLRTIRKVSFTNRGTSKAFTRSRNLKHLQELFCSIFYTTVLRLWNDCEKIMIVFR